MRSTLLSFVGLTLATLWTVQVYALTLPPNDGFVTDAVGVLSDAEEEAIEQELLRYSQETSNEIAVVIVDSLQGEAPVDVAVEIGRAWGVGTEEDDNGIVVLVAYSDREVFLAPGYGLEGAVPDLVAKGIIDTDITPAFRNGDYAEGISTAIDSLEKHIGGEYTADRYEPGITDASWLPYFLFFVFVVLNFFGSIMAQSKSWWLGGVIGGVFGIILTAIFSWWLSIPALVIIGLFFDYIVSQKGKGGKNGRRGGGGGFWGGGGFGGGSSSGRGGFSGFSGGSFGGGGAGGRW